MRRDKLGRILSFVLAATLAILVAPASRDTRPQGESLEPGRDPRHVVVRFVEGSDVQTVHGRFVSASGTSDLRGVNETLTRYRARPASDQAPADRFFVIDVPAGADTAAIVRSLESQGVVQTAYSPGRGTAGQDGGTPPPPPPPSDTPTPDLTGLQRYTDAAPGGMDSDYANTLPGGNGAGVRIVDVEQSWQFDHEDLMLPADTLISGVVAPNDNHGTNVLGIQVARANGFGVTGMAPAASVKASSSCFALDQSKNCTVSDTARAVDAAVTHLTSSGIPGKIILIEFQGAYGYPMEYYPDVYTSIVNAVNQGIVVVELAGNGGHDLDAYADANGNHIFQRSFRDSGAIMVGAGCPPAAGDCADRTALQFSNWGSNYGSRVDVQGHGEKVTTLGGYGDAFNGGHYPNKLRWYTSMFDGTSSAGATVTGAVAALQGWQIASFGTPMTPSNIRNLLVSTGTPQPSSDASVRHIGPRPNLAQATSDRWWWWVDVVGTVEFADDYTSDMCGGCGYHFDPKLILRSLKGELSFLMALPGITSERQIAVKTGPASFTVTASRPATKQEQTRYGTSTVKFSRSMALPKGVSTSDMRGKFTSGTLQVTFPRS